MSDAKQGIAGNASPGLSAYRRTAACQAIAAILASEGTERIGNLPKVRFAILSQVRFAVRPDLALYFRVPIDVSLERLMARRVKLKFYEAGMDMGWSNNPVESFRQFQGKVLTEYDRLVDEFGLEVLEAVGSVAVQVAGRGLAAARLNEVAIDEAFTRAVRALVVVGNYFVVLARERARVDPRRIRRRWAVHRHRRAGR